MNPHSSEDTDEENCDDPIKLFDNDNNAVYFGSRPNGHRTRDTDSHWEVEVIGRDVLCQPRDNSTLTRPDDVTETLQSGVTSECDISPSCVKLVDCGKFPWYFKKYTQQIMNKMNLNEDSDSDHDIDVEGIVDDSDDCFIVEDLQDVTNKVISKDKKCVNTVTSIVNESLDFMKRRRDDMEIQTALSVRNLLKVDFKRNQGLLGMKITRKNETNSTDVKTDWKAVCNVVEETDEKQKSVIADKFSSSTDKTFGQLDTQLILTTEEKDTNSVCQFKANIEEKDLIDRPTLIKSSTSKNIPVQFHISKIPEKLINDLKTKKINDQTSEAKLISKLSNKSLSKDSDKKNNISDEKEIMIVNEKPLSYSVKITKKLTNSLNKITSHVKDVKKTNKYKNDQIKNSASESSLSNYLLPTVLLLVTNKSKEDIKDNKCMKQNRKDNTQSKVAKLDRKPRKKIKNKKREPNSPILHCSTVPKKPKLKMPAKCNQSDTNSNLPKDLGKLKQIVDKLTLLNNNNLVQGTNRPNHVIPKVVAVTKPVDVHTKEPLQKVSSIIQDKTCHLKPSNVSEHLSKNCNDVSKTVFKTNKFHNTQNMSSSQNKTLNEQNVLHESHQYGVYKHKINTISVTNRISNANNKPAVCNSNVSRATVASPASGAKSVLTNQYANVPTSHGAHFPIHNAVPSKMISNNIPNNKTKTPVQNSYASAIILKSNNQTNFPFEKYCDPPVQNMARHSSMTIPSHLQARCRDPQLPYSAALAPASLDRRQTYFQSTAHSVPNQYLPPHGHLSQRPSNPMQDFYRECWLPQNLAGRPPPPPLSPTLASLDRRQTYFQSSADSVPNQFLPAYSHNSQRPSNTMQDFYRDCWLPQNLAPPPPPSSNSPPNIPPKNGHNINQSKDAFNLNRPSVMQNPQSASRQTSVNTLQTKNSSIIGMNNDGLVKKINIVAMPVKKNVSNKMETVKAEQINISETSPLEDLEVVATKTEMLKELDKLSFVDKDINDNKKKSPASNINENKKENALEVAIMSKKPGRFETLKLTMKTNAVETKPANGYSPPILPIPTYQKVLDRVTSNSQTQSAIPETAFPTEDIRSNSKNESKPMRKRDFVKCCKRKVSNAWNNDEDRRRKDDAKKISLEEYKKRILNNDCKSEPKKMCKEKYSNGEKRPNIDFKCRKNVDYGTETDLGYDSDSTVVL